MIRISSFKAHCSVITKKWPQQTVWFGTADNAAHLLLVLRVLLLLLQEHVSHHLRQVWQHYELGKAGIIYIFKNFNSNFFDCNGANHSFWNTWVESPLECPVQEHKLFGAKVSKYEHLLFSPRSVSTWPSLMGSNSSCVSEIKIDICDVYSGAMNDCPYKFTINKVPNELKSYLSCYLKVQGQPDLHQREYYQ